MDPAQAPVDNSDEDTSDSSSSAVPPEPPVADTLSEPTPQAEPIQSVPKFKADSTLTDAVAYQESHYNPHAIGPKTKYGRAVGEMQILDSTGADTAKELGIKPDEINLFDRAQNRKIGTRTLEDYTNEFGGDVKLGLAAYNSGPQTVKNLQARYGDSYGDIAAHLPDETQKYVPSVLKHQADLQSGALKGSQFGDVGAPQNPNAQLLDAAKQVPATDQGYATVMKSVIGDPMFDNLSLSDKMGKIATVYNAQEWPTSVQDITKQITSGYWDAATPAEKPNLADIVGAPPVVREDQDVNSTIDQWKADAKQKLKDSGVPAPLLGQALDNYLNDAGQSETEAYAIRNRSDLGYAVRYAPIRTLEVAQGAASLPASVAAAITNLAGFPETAETIDNIPQTVPNKLFGKVPNDFVFKTTDSGHPVINPDGSLQTLFGYDAANTVGQIGAMISGGEALKATELSIGARGLLLNGVNTLSTGQGIYKSIYAETGDREAAFRGAMYAVPAGFAGTLGQLSILGKLTTPALNSMSPYARAAYMADLMARNAATNFVAGASMNTLSQAGVSSETDRPINVKEAIGAGLVQGAFGGIAAAIEGPLSGKYPALTPDVLSAEPQGPRGNGLGFGAPYEGRNAVTRLGLPPGAPPPPAQLEGGAQPKLLSGPTVGPETPTEPIARPSVDEETQAVKQLETFRQSKASTLVLSASDAAKIPSQLFKAYQVTPTSDDLNATLTKKQTYIPVDSEDSEQLDKHIAKLQQDLSYLPSPEQPSVQEKILNYKDAASEYYGLARSVTTGMADAANQQKALLNNIDSKKAEYEAVSRRNPDLKEAKKTELDAAYQAYDDLHNSNKDLYGDSTEVGQKVQALGALQSKMEDAKRIRDLVLTPTYANDYTAREANLQNLLLKRKAINGETLTPEERLVANPAALLRNERQNAVTKAGLQVDALTSFSDGAHVDGHNILPINNKWYVADNNGKLLGGGHSYFGDAVQSLKPKVAINPEKSFIIRAGKDKTALSPEQGKEIEAATVREKGIKADQEAIGKAYNRTINQEETQNAIARAEAEKQSRQVSQPQEPKKVVSEVTALKDRAFTEGATSKAQPSSEPSLDRAAKGPSTNRENRINFTKLKPNKPYTSNYTKQFDFPQNGTEVVPASAVIKEMQKSLDKLPTRATIKEGARTKANVRGYFRPSNTRISIAEHNDVLTAAHEYQHAIDDALISRAGITGAADYSGLSDTLKNALKDHTETIYAEPPADENGQLAEGLATFYQHYVSGQPVRQEVLDWYHNEFARQNPETYKDMEAIKDAAFKHYNMTTHLYDSTLAKEPPTSIERKVGAIKRYTNLKNLRDEWERSNLVLRDIDTITGGRTKLERLSDVNQGLAHALADQWTRGQGVYNPWTGQYHGMSLKQAISPMKGSKENFIALDKYLRNNAWLADLKKGINTPSNEEDILKSIREVEQENPNAVKAANNIWKWVDNANDVIRSTSEVAANMIDKERQQNRELGLPGHGYYAPLQKVGYGGFAATKARTGSTKDTIKPLNNYQRAMSQRLAKSLKYQEHVALVQAAALPQSFLGSMINEVTGMQARGLQEKYDQQIAAKLGEENASKLSAVDRAEYSLMAEPFATSERGQPVIALASGKGVRFFETDPRLARYMSNTISPLLKHPFFKFLGFGNTLFRNAATGFRLAFQLVQAPRQFGAVYRSAKPIASGPLHNVKDLKTAMQVYMQQLIDNGMHFIGHGDPESVTAVTKRMGLGGSNGFDASANLSEKYANQYGNKFVDLSSAGLHKLAEFIDIPNQALRQTSLVLEALAQGNHYSNGKLNFKEGGLKMDDALDLMLAAKAGPTNYSVGGYSAKTVSRIKPFFAAYIRHLSRIPEDFKRNSGRMTALGIATMGVGVLSALLHKGDEDYAGLTPEEKMHGMMWHVNLGGVGKWMFFPLDTYLGGAYGIGSLIGEEINKHGSIGEAEKWLAGMYSAYSPLPGSKEEAAQFGGRIVSETVAQIANKDLHFKTPIVPTHLQSVNHPETEYNEYTSSLAKWLGKELGWSPMRIDHVIKNSAPVASDILNAVDHATGGKKDENAKTFLLSAWMHSGTTADVSSEQSKEFQTKLGEARDNQPIEDAKEKQLRLSLEHVNQNVHNATIVLSGTADTDARSELRAKRKEYMLEGIAIAQGSGETVSVSPSLKGQAKQIRNTQKTEKAEKLRSAKVVDDELLKGDTSPSGVNSSAE